MNLKCIYNYIKVCLRYHSKARLTDQKLDKKNWINSFDAIVSQPYMHLITSKLDQIIIHKLDQKRDQKQMNR